ncbi:hypothetical protein F0263_16465, partial [Vibrio anguillarum]|nr:hypothetical protein [Vibrio anguillarum]
GVGYVRSPQSHSLPMLMGTHSLAAYLQLQVVWVYNYRDCLIIVIIFEHVQMKSGFQLARQRHLPIHRL